MSGEQEAVAAIRAGHIEAAIIDSTGTIIETILKEPQP